MTTPCEAGKTRRLHPASLLFSLGSAARRLLLPGVVILFASRGSNFELWLSLLFFPAAGAALARYWSYRYRLGPEEMIVREGIVTRNERHIPYDRIQNINLVQNPLHRWLRVSEVHLETAGGEEPEAVIRVLSTEAIEELRARVVRSRSAGARTAGAVRDSDRPGDFHGGAEAAPRPAVVQLPTGEVVLLGLLSNKGIAVVAALAGLAWQLDYGWEDLVERLPFSWGRVAGTLSMAEGPATAALILLVTPTALVLLKLFSVVWAVLKFHGFALRREGDDLRTEYGLLTRVSATIPRHRVQLLSERSRPLQRSCRRTTILVQTAGGSADEGAAVDRRWLAPLLPRERLQPVVTEVFPEIDLAAVEWRPLALPARRRRFVRSARTILALIALAALGVGPWAFSGAALALPLAWIHAGLWCRHARYAVTPTALVQQSGWWVRRTSIVRYSKIQAVAVRASPFDRRHRMASLQVDTAGAGRVGLRIDIPYLDAVAARALAARLFAEAGRTKFRW